MLRKISISIFLLLLVFIAGFVFQKFKLVYDAGNIKGSEIINTTELERFCSETGYIPFAYINAYKEHFNESIVGANNVLLKFYDSLEEAQKDLTTSIAEDNNWLEEYNNAIKPTGMTKKEFCKMFDDQKDTMLEIQITYLKNNKLYHKN